MKTKTIKYTQIKIHLMNIAQIVKYKNTQQFYEGSQNRHTKYKN